MSPNQREDNLRARAPLATVGSEGSSRGNVEHNESKPKMAYKVGNPAKYGKAPKLEIYFQLLPTSLSLKYNPMTVIEYQS